MNRRKPEAYPDISDILARKAEGRREIAGRSFGEKIANDKELRERAFRRSRERANSAIKQAIRRSHPVPTDDLIKSQQLIWPTD